MKHGSVVQGKVQVGKTEVAMWKVRVCSFRGGGRSLELVCGERKRFMLCEEVMRLEGRAAPLGCAVLCKNFRKIRRTCSVGIRMWLGSSPSIRGLGLDMAGGHRGWWEEEGRSRSVWTGKKEEPQSELKHGGLVLIRMIRLNVERMT